MGTIVLIFVFGALFGLILQYANLNRYNVISGQALLKDNMVAKTILLTIGVGAILLSVTIGMGFAQFHVKPFITGGLILGGLIFGTGMAILGYCPGTLAVSLGEGSVDALIGVVGGLLGGLVYTLVLPSIEGILGPDLGKLSLFSLLGNMPVFYYLTTAIVGMMIIYVAFYIHIVEKSYDKRWIFAGIALALLDVVVFLSFTTNRPIGASTTFPWLADTLAGLTDNAYFQKINTPGSWEGIFLLGAMVAAFTGSRLKGDFKITLIHSNWKEYKNNSAISRIVWAFIGGFVLIFGARMAGGCTSGHIISGGMQMAFSSFTFGIFMFAGLVITGKLFYKSVATNMKKHHIIVLILILLVSYQANGQIKIKGEIKNFTSEKLKILDKREIEIEFQEFHIENGKFNKSINIPDGYYLLNYGDKYVSIFLKNGFDLEINFDANNFEKSLTYSGNGSKENNYLIKKWLLINDFGELNYIAYYTSLNEKEFLALNDSLYKTKLNLLEIFNAPKYFLEIEKKSLEYDYLNHIATYPLYKRYFTKDKEFTVSPDYPDPYKNLDLNNEYNLLTEYYRVYLEHYFLFLNDEKIKDNKNSDITLSKIELIDATIKNQKIKEELAFYLGYFEINRSKKQQEVFNLLNKIITDTRYRVILSRKYKYLKKPKRNFYSLELMLLTKNNKTVDINKFKGDFLYIDIWATWCAACKKEIPYLEQLQEKYKKEKIQFISIAWNDKKIIWNNFIKNINGIQLFAPNNDDEFFRELKISSLPRFIIIDPKGNIINEYAERPSSKKITQVLNEILK
jgi:thiol-disulfide isomerase/thioredoxin/uncharacterized membrane protein YedE/YeeE